ncbi:copper chaperone PCu(A)C [Mesobacterium sp. TK19101]|uniref:Copper chaperone PCu(A)C n=1 Tax=Mesobacterium hydrothermale TaxID=3111907 RepID=A0ABU6HL09_9RHOB|nr:copper chaperone PCu(A)C [Mesobacterium sp. TK19101]MEC3862599.1 copper chaperone PCu(A)C [Mesobacterium sp. TK19101]
MTFKTVLAAVAATAFAMPAFADIVIGDPYARASTAMSKSGAAFMAIENTGAEDDRLIDAQSDVAAKVELHTHQSDANGVMKMVHVEEGFVIPAGETHMLARGGDHVMFLGLNKTLNQGDIVTVTLTFEKAGDIVVEVPVDLDRKPMHGKMGGNMGHNHGNMGQSN